jgi:hypothetical protein
MIQGKRGLLGSGGGKKLLGVSGAGLVRRGLTSYRTVVSSLLTGIKAYWKLEEASGNRVDSTGRGNDATPTNTPGNTTGKVGNALNLVRTSSQYVSKLASADVNFGTSTDWSVVFWVKFASKPAGSTFLWSRSDAGEVSTWGCYYSSAADRLRANGTGPAEVSAQADNFGAISTGTWMFVVIGFTSSSQTLSIQVNNGVANSATPPSAITVTTGDLFIGGYLGGEFDGDIDEFGIWHRLLTAAEITELYNSGTGITYPF